MRVKVTFFNGYRSIIEDLDNPLPEQKCAVSILLLWIRPRQGDIFRKICKIDKNVQIYKNVPRIGFFVKAGRRFVKRMETHKFVHTNLLIDPHPL